MSTSQLGRLTKVDLRTAWLSEASDFTPWLAQEENLNLLGDAVNLELELESQEKDVGPFRADILCKDTANDSWVLIENQLERTDHGHLGQLLTYAAGLDAVTIIWVAQRFTEEHRAALDWLNDRTDRQINFFGLEIELWQIGDSPVAPKFNIICQPNDWTRTIKQAAGGGGELTPHKQIQLGFWTAFKAYMEDQGSFVKCQKPPAQHWTSHAVGRTGIHLNSIVSSWNSETNKNEPEIRVELYLTGSTAESNFAELSERKDQIETTLGFPLTWYNPEKTNMRRIYTRTDADFTDESSWPTHFAWLKQRLEAMHRVFSPIVKQLKR